ncbi:pre-mRNA splicing factor cwc24 [Apiospora marii]|uniref:Pre-mRNA-splicing factor CWC24 n=1 Tax=Apiospora marii TaxID=335849 RepID=A0ABR1T1A0_9PEZI
MTDTNPPAAAAPADGPIAPVSLFKKRGAKGKAAMRKRPATPPPAERNSDSDSDYTSSENESGQRVKRRKKNSAVVTASSKNNVSAPQHESATLFEADRSVPMTSTNDATKQSNWYDEDKNLLGKTRAMPSKTSADTPDEPAQPDGTYKGLANSNNFIQKNPNAPKKSVGPIKAPTNIRTVTTTDFAPDVCKDYKQTGFCGFGDNCKYLHAREDYAQGWKLDREWENVTKGKKNLGGTVVASADRSGRSKDDDDDETTEAAMLEKIPFACIICKGPYRSPVVTRCGHYFCEPCALQRYRKDPSCAACGSGTSGVFNNAKKLSQLLDKKREKAAKRRQKAIENGEEVPEDEEEAAAK